jgi:hypothetical protein
MASTILSPRQRTTKQLQTIATIAIVGVAYFAGIIVVLHFLRPDLNPIGQPASQYALGPYGFLMSSAFFSMAVAAFALVIGLYQGTSQPARSRLGLVLLALWGVGVSLAMLFPMDPDGAPATLGGTIHNVTGPLAFLSVTAGTLILSQRFKKDENWRPIYRAALVLSIILLPAFLLTFLSFVTQAGFTGLAQRIFLAALVAWMALTAAHLRSIAPEMAG